MDLRHGGGTLHNSIAVAAESISFMPGYGFAVAASTLVGQNLGAVKKEEAEESALRAILMGTLFMTVIGLVFFFFPTLIIAIFTDLPDVMSLAARCIRIGAFEQPFIALSMILAASLRSQGHPGTLCGGCRQQLACKAAPYIHGSVCLAAGSDLCLGCNADTVYSRDRAAGVEVFGKALEGY